MNGTLTFPHTAGSPNTFPIAPFGFEGGYHTEGDVLPRVTETADGVSLGVIWEEMQATLQQWNNAAANLAGLLSYWHTSAADAVPASIAQNLFEKASEYGEPVAIRPGSYTLVGFPFDDFDTATRFTWKFLRDADARQVRAAHNEALAADSRLVTSAILQRLFDPTQDENEQGTPVYGLFNGDGMVPAPFAGQSFTGAETHYTHSGNTAIDSGDVESAIKLVKGKGFGVPESGQTLLLLCHPNQADDIMSWKKGAENTNSAVAKYDALPSVGAPAFEIPGQIVGQQAPAEIFNVPVVGSYGPALIVESYFVPAGYFSVVATSGPNSSNNALGVRQHPNSVYQGLRQIPGNIPGYPLQESFYTRGFGVGTRHRGAAAVCQITDGGSYTAPTITV